MAHGERGGGVEHGVWHYVDRDGQLVALGSFDHGQPVGRWRFWYADGRPLADVRLEEGLEGPCLLWSPEGRLQCQLRSYGGDWGSWTVSYAFGAEWLDRPSLTPEQSSQLMQLWIRVVPMDWNGSGIYFANRFVRPLEHAQDSGEASQSRAGISPSN